MTIRIVTEIIDESSHELNNYPEKRQVSFDDLYDFVQEPEWNEIDVDWFCHNWYRDQNGLDLTLFDGVSYGQALTGSLKIAMASVVRDYHALTRLKGSHSQVLLPANSPRILQEVAGEVFQELKIIDGDFTKSDGAWLEERVLRDYLSFKIPFVPSFIINCMRAVQKVAFTTTRDVERLVIGDWTNLGVQHDSVPTLWTNYYKSFGSCAFICAPSSRKIRRLKSTSAYAEVFDGIEIDEVLRGHLKPPSQTLQAAITKVLLRILKENSQWIAFYQIQIKELLNRYRPAHIELPAELFEPYSVALMIANQKSIPATLMIDGHDISGTYIPVLRDQANKSLRFSKLVSYSQDQENTAKKLGIDESMIIRRESLFWRWYRNQSGKAREYGFIIMTSIPNNYNPVANIESPKETLRFALEVALQHTDKRIGIKVKDLKIEKSFVKKVVSDLAANDRVDILVGTFSEHVHKAEFVIGGISTAAAESMMASVPYLIFEPESNGYSDEFLFNSTTLSTASIARDKASLIQMVQARTNSIKSPRDRFLGFSAQ